MAGNTNLAFGEVNLLLQVTKKTGPEEYKITAVQG